MNPLKGQKNRVYVSLSQIPKEISRDFDCKK